MNSNQKLRQRGAGMTEYLIVVALIAISSIAVFERFGEVMRDQVTGVSYELAGKDSSTKTKPQTDAQHAANAAAHQFTMADYSSAQELTKKKD